MIVNGRVKALDILGNFHHHKNTSKKIFTNLSQLPNLFIAKHTHNIAAVYERSRAIVVPSLGFESFGRVATEAAFNNIPSIVSTSGGLAEAQMGAGIVLEAPASSQKDYFALPSNEEIKPWIEALSTILSADYTQAFKKARSHHSLKTSTARALMAFEPLFAKRASFNPHIILNGSYRPPFS